MKRAPLILLALVATSLGLGFAVGGCTNNGTCRGAACGGGGGGGGGGKGLSISPASATLPVVGGAAMQQLTATYGGEDVTKTATWTLGDKNAGTLTNGLFTSAYPLPHGGNVAVTATWQGTSAGASITLVYTAPDVLDKGAPNDAPQSFGGNASSDPKEVPKIIYPFDGAMLARNINQIDVQWSGSSKDKLFRLHFQGATIDSTFYVGAGACSDQGNGTTHCHYQPLDAAWQTLAVSASGQNLSMTVSATSGNGAPVADSATATLNLSPEDVKGGFYWFSPSKNGLKRLPFGAATATDFVSNGGGYNCTGCHTVSRDGKKVASTFYGADGTGGMVDGTNGKKFLIRPESFQGTAAKRWNFATFNPDATLLLTNWAGVLTLRDGTTGAKKFDVPMATTGGQAVMPEWSPDGKSVAFVQVPPEGKLGKDLSSGFVTAGDWIVGNAGNIATMAYDNGTFSPAQVIVPSDRASEYNFYPSWSPDSQWLVFATGKYPGSSATVENNLGTTPKGYLISYDQDSARLRMVQALPGGAVIELANATHAMNKTATWPKFAPFIQGGSLVFVTFSAKFNYGYVVTDGKTPQLWMSAIDLKKASGELGSSDPSYPPFWLPFQSPTEKNHSGIWTSDVACNMDQDCPSEFSCQAGMCQPVNPG